MRAADTREEDELAQAIEEAAGSTAALKASALYSKLDDLKVRPLGALIKGTAPLRDEDAGAQQARVARGLWRVLRKEHGRVALGPRRLCQRRSGTCSCRTPLGASRAAASSAACATRVPAAARRQRRMQAAARAVQLAWREWQRSRHARLRVASEDEVYAPRSRGTGTPPSRSTSARWLTAAERSSS